MIAEGYRGRHFASSHQALEEGDMEDTSWPPGTENPADGLAEVRGDMIPLLRLLESGRFSWESLAPSRAWAGRSKWPLGRTRIIFARARAGRRDPVLGG